MTSDKRMSDERLREIDDWLACESEDPEPDFEERAINNCKDLRAEIDALRAELTAARTVEDGKVASTVMLLRDVAGGLFVPGTHFGRQMNNAADLLTRLSSAKAEAERQIEDDELQHADLGRMRKRLATAERERDEALEKLGTQTFVLEHMGAEMDTLLSSDGISRLHQSCVDERKARLAAEAALAQAREALEQIAAFNDANGAIMILDEPTEHGGKKLIGVASFAARALSTLTKAKP